MTPCATLAISFRNKNEIHECGMYFSSINAFLWPSGLWQVNTTKFPGSSLVMHLMEIALFLSFRSFEAWKQYWYQIFSYSTFLKKHIFLFLFIVTFLTLFKNLQAVLFILIQICLKILNNQINFVNIFIIPCDFFTRPCENWTLNVNLGQNSRHSLPGADLRSKLDKRSDLAVWMSDFFTVLYIPLLQFTSCFHCKDVSSLTDSIQLTLVSWRQCRQDGFNL